MSASSPSTSGSSGMSAASELPQPDGLVAELAADERFSAGRRVPLVEREVEDAEDRAEPLGEEVVRRHAERDAGLADLALRAHEPLRERRLGNEERARDLRRGQARDHAQRQGDADVGRKRRVAAGEDQLQALVGRAQVVLLGTSISSRRASSSVLRASVRSRRIRSIARFRAVAMIQAPGLRGVPSPQRSSATVNGVLDGVLRERGIARRPRGSRRRAPTPRGRRRRRLRRLRLVHDERPHLHRHLAWPRESWTPTRSPRRGPRQSIRK